MLRALRRTDRKFFLPGAPDADVYADRALPIGGAQTCSEPSMVAFMLDILELAEGHRHLEIGAGSGYAAACAALLCGPSGLVVACEVLPNLAAGMEDRLRAWSEDLLRREGRAAAGRIEVLCADGSAGFPERAPFDRILLSAGVPRGGAGFREELLLDQLSEDGILVYPETRGSLFRLRRRRGGVVREAWPGVAFVPLRGRNS